MDFTSSGGALAVVMAAERCFSRGDGCRKDLDKARENFLLASKLGHVWAMIELGWLLDESDPQRWRWWGQAAALGEARWFLPSFAKQVELFNLEHWLWNCFCHVCNWTSFARICE